MTNDHARIEEISSLPSKLTVKCGVCRRIIGRYGYVPPELAEDLLGDDVDERVRATREVVVEGTVLCPACATEHRRRDEPEGGSNSPCQVCGWIPEMEFGRLRLCVHQSVGSDRRVGRVQVML